MNPLRRCISCQEWFQPAHEHQHLCLDCCNAGSKVILWWWAMLIGVVLMVLFFCL